MAASRACRTRRAGVAVGTDRRRPSNPSGIARTRATTSWEYSKSLLSKGPCPLSPNSSMTARRSGSAPVSRWASTWLGGFGPKVARLRLVDHLELRIDAYLEGVLAQDARGHRADGAHPGIIHLQRFLRKPLLAQKSADAVAQLRGGLHGEGNGEHLVDGLQTAGRLLAGEQPVGDAPRQGEGLSRAGAGGDHEGAVEGGDGKALALFAGIEIHASLPGQS